MLHCLSYQPHIPVLEVFYSIHIWVSRQALYSHNVARNCGLGILSPLTMRVHSPALCNQLDNDAFSATLNFRSSAADLIAHNPQHCGTDHVTQPCCGLDLLLLCTLPPLMQPAGIAD